MRYLVVALVAVFVTVTGISDAQDRWVNVNKGGAVTARHEVPQTPGRFLMAISVDAGTAWRFDTATGAISYCLTATHGIADRPSGCSDWTK